MPRGCVPRIRLWPLRRDEGRRSDWPAHVLANDVSRKIDRFHAFRHKWQLHPVREEGGYLPITQRSAKEEMSL